jgi:hypothetical protein
MALLSFLEYMEWRGQRDGSVKNGDRRKTGGRPKGKWVGGNPRYGKSRGNDNFSQPDNTRAQQKQHGFEE